MRTIETPPAEPGPAGAALDLGYVWPVEGDANLYARARDLIARARESAYLAALPADLSALEPALRTALGRGVRVVVFATERHDLPGARVVVSSLPKQERRQQYVPRTILVVDGAEALIGEQLGSGCVRGCWTQSPLLVSTVEHYVLRGGQRRFLIEGRSQREG